MSKNFKQYDSRWGTLKYPSGSDNMANSGCGATACASVIVNNSKYKNITPKDTRNFMVKNGYAIANQGTAWSGIAACLKHYGLSVKEHKDMDSFFKEMAKSKRKAIILFRGGTRGGVTWTNGGHYVCAVNYKVKNGKHWLYIYDGGQRKHTGWYCYEKHMKGLIPTLWTCYVPSSTKPTVKTVTKKASTTPKKTTTSTTKKTVKTNFLYASTLYASQVEKSPWKYSNSGSKKSWASAKKNHIINCARLMCFVMQYAGVIPKGKCVYYKNGLKGDAEAIKALKNSSKVSLLHPNCKIKNCSLKEGDIICTSNHMMMYRGKDKHGHRVWDSAGGSDMKAHNCTKRVKTSYDNKKCLLIIRPKDK